MRTVVLVLLIVVTACGKSTPDRNAAVCDHYAALARECAEDVPAGELAQLELMSRDFCRKGMSGRHEEIFGERYKKMIECTRNADGCEAYRGCQAE